MRYIKLLILGLILIPFSCVKRKPPIPTKILGVVTVEMDANKSPLRNTESVLGNLFADGISYSAKKEGFNFDFALMNGGAIRFNEASRSSGIYPAGEVSNVTVDEMHPFFDLSVIVNVSGEKLYSIFERSCANIESLHGSFLQVSSEIEVVYDIKNQAQVLNEITFPNTIVTQGERVISLKLNGVEIDSGANYRVLVSNFLSDGGDGFIDFLNVSLSQKENTKLQITEMINTYIRDNSPLTPEISGRISVIQ